MQWDADSLKAMKLERGRVRSVLNPKFRSGCNGLSMEEQGACPRCTSVDFLSFVMFGTLSDSDVYSSDAQLCSSHNTIT